MACSSGLLATTISWTWGTCLGIISQPENRSLEEPDQPDGTLSKRKSLTTLEEPSFSTIPIFSSKLRPELTQKVARLVY